MGNVARLHLCQCALIVEFDLLLCGSGRSGMKPFAMTDLRLIASSEEKNVRVSGGQSRNYEIDSAHTVTRKRRDCHSMLFLSETSTLIRARSATPVSKPVAWRR